ncbi:lysophospholipid acyltransferase family protein [Pseudonocardia humida]|uniref:1-acyl-sn-glycerol-3-phosphate acyltransferase n=1 Tax=Pseudonocardia humida TaxID=2800819 RepID=A0ABT0ZUK7_9PSEU|nr:lysophospholipid acyltransferase family protein [Pseudonocardia humida]MCO1654414.1 1-acyl-sn-glycerol-3-phosphate acyltransferase [Pseudonocardia humida]
MPADTPLTVGQKLRLSFTRRRRGTGFWYGLAIALLWPPTVYGPRLSWRGGEHIPREGGALLVANHVSFADPIYEVAFAVSHGRVPRFLAKSELWGIPGVRWVMRGGGHVPVDRTSMRAGDAAMRELTEAVKRGEVVVFYPEGTYTGDPDGWPMKGKNGIGRIALVTGAPVIPVANWGTQDLLPPNKGLRPFPRKRVHVVAGPPVDLSAWLGGPRTRKALDGATAAIMADVTALVAEIRGQTPPAVPFDPEAPDAPPLPTDPVVPAAPVAAGEPVDPQAPRAAG